MLLCPDLSALDSTNVWVDNTESLAAWDHGFAALQAWAARHITPPAVVLARSTHFDVLDSELPLDIPVAVVLPPHAIRADVKALALREMEYVVRRSGNLSKWTLSLAWHSELYALTVPEAALSDSISEQYVPPGETKDVMGLLGVIFLTPARTSIQLQYLGEDFMNGVRVAALRCFSNCDPRDDFAFNALAIHQHFSRRFLEADFDHAGRLFIELRPCRYRPDS